MWIFLAGVMLAEVSESEMREEEEKVDDSKLMSSQGGNSAENDRKEKSDERRNQQSGLDIIVEVEGEEINEEEEPMTDQDKEVEMDVIIDRPTEKEEDDGPTEKEEDRKLSPFSDT